MLDFLAQRFTAEPDWDASFNVKVARVATAPDRNPAQE